MSPPPERKIYSIEEAALQVAQSVSDLLNEGILGKLQFFVSVPDNIQVMNVGKFDQRVQESSNPVMRRLHSQAYDQKPLRTTGIEVLMLSSLDCKKILTIGTFAQDAFCSAGKLDTQSLIQNVVLEKPPENKLGIGLSYSFPRCFATYAKQVSPERWSQETAPERLSVTLTVDKLRVSADALKGYIKAPSSVIAAPSILAISPNGVPEPSSKKKRTRSSDDLSGVIKKAFLKVEEEDRSDNRLVWNALLKMAKSDPAPPPLIDEVPDGIRYFKSSGEEETLTYRKFLGRLETLRNKLQAQLRP